MFFDICRSYLLIIVLFQLEREIRKTFVPQIKKFVEIINQFNKSHV